MVRTLFAFYEIDAAPQHGVAGELSERLGAVTGAPGFVEGALYVRADNGGIALQLAYDSPAEDAAWQREPTVAAMLRTVDWRSRDADVRTCDLLHHIGGVGAPADSAVFAIQRFVIAASKAANFAELVSTYTVNFARSIGGFRSADIFASDDRSNVVVVTPWAHEQALRALEDRPGSLDAMQAYLQIADHHAFATYERVSHLKGATRAT